jgi:hypothetical protein
MIKRTILALTTCAALGVIPTTALITPTAASAAVQHTSHYRSCQPADPEFTFTLKARNVSCAVARSVERYFGSHELAGPVQSFRIAGINGWRWERTSPVVDAMVAPGGLRVQMTHMPSS